MIITRRDVIRTLASLPAVGILRGQSSCPIPPQLTIDHLVMVPSIQYGTKPIQHYESCYWSTFNPTACPIAIFIHGGGWEFEAGINGWQNLLTPLAQAGFYVVFPHYTLSTAAVPSWPVVESDIKALLDYLSEGRAGDPTRISIIGWSAGAHLALMAGFSDPSTYDTASSCMRNPYSVRCVVGCSTPTDLVTLFQTSIPSVGANAQQAVSQLLGFNPTLNKTAAMAASPVGILGNPNVSIPPTLLIAGDQDILVPRSQSAELVAVAGTLGIGIQYDVLAGLNHSLDLQTANGRSVIATVNWLNQYGK